MRFVRGRYYLFQSTNSPASYWLVEFKRRMETVYEVYSLACSYNDFIGNSSWHTINFPIGQINDPKQYTIKEVAPIDLPLYFGDYTGRRYKDILSGLNPNRTYSKSVQGKAVALKRKSSFTRKSFSDK